jgi:hypothetical protein
MSSYSKLPHKSCTYEKKHKPIKEMPIYIKKASNNTIKDSASELVQLEISARANH